MVARYHDEWKGFFEEAKTQRWVVQSIITIIIIIIIIIIIVICSLVQVRMKLKNRLILLYFEGNNLGKSHLKDCYLLQVSWRPRQASGGNPAEVDMFSQDVNIPKKINNSEIFWTVKWRQAWKYRLLRREKKNLISISQQYLNSYHDIIRQIDRI